MIYTWDILNKGPIHTFAQLIINNTKFQIAYHINKKLYSLNVLNLNYPNNDHYWDLFKLFNNNKWTLPAKSLNDAIKQVNLLLNKVEKLKAFI